MEVVQPQREVWERFASDGKKAREYEDIDVLALFRKVSVPKEMSYFNFDDLGRLGGEIRLPRKAKSVQGLVRMVEIDTTREDEADYDDDEDEDDDDDDEKDEEDQGDEYIDALREKCLKDGINPFWSGAPISLPDLGYRPDHKLSEKSIVRNIWDEDDWDEDDSEEEVLVPPQTRGLGGLCFLRAEGELLKGCEASLRSDVECALQEYKRQEGVDYEFVKADGSHLTSPPESEPDPDCHGKHMNFFAKLKGGDSSPEYFFASLSSQAVHCCKLIYDPTMDTIQHCEHTKCLECDLWTYRKKESRKKN